jgi:phosphatidylglycerophosphate synthase
MPEMSPPRRHTHREVVAAAKDRDAWWTELLIEPAAIRLVRPLANQTPTTPNQLTALSAMLTVAAAGGLLEGGRFGFTAGALLLQLSLLVGCMDGTLARLTGEVTALGGWFDAAAGRARFLLCAPAPLVGQYDRTEDRDYLLLAALVVSCYALVQIIDGQAQRFPGGLPHGAAGTFAAPARPARGARPTRPRLLARPVTEVELMLVVCVIAPQTGVYVPVIVTASALLLVGELAVLGAAVRLVLRARSGRPLFPPQVARNRYGEAVHRGPQR